MQVGPIAQSVEQRTFNPWVDGSSPSGPTSCRNTSLKVPICDWVSTQMLVNSKP